MPIRHDNYLEGVPTVGDTIRERRKREENEEFEGIKQRRQNDNDFQKYTREKQFDFVMDRRRNDAGIFKGGARPAATPKPPRIGGYKTIDQIPNEAGGLPLRRVRQDGATGTYMPDYEREAVPAKVQEAEGLFELGERKKTADRDRRQNHPTAFERMSDSIMDRVGGFFKPQNPGGQSDEAYENMSEDEIYKLAQAGDKKAVAVGQRRFGSSNAGV